MSRRGPKHRSHLRSLESEIARQMPKRGNFDPANPLGTPGLVGRDTLITPTTDHPTIKIGATTAHGRQWVGPGERFRHTEHVYVSAAERAPGVWVSVLGVRRDDVVRVSQGVTEPVSVSDLLVGATGYGLFGAAIVGALLGLVEECPETAATVLYSLMPDDEVALQRESEGEPIDRTFQDHLFQPDQLRSEMSRVTKYLKSIGYTKRFDGSPTPQPVRPPAFPPHWRSDAPLIKSIAKELGTHEARRWARLPLVSIPDDLYQSICARSAEIIEAVPDIPALPWDDFLFDLGRSTPDEELTRQIARSRARGDHGQATYWQQYLDRIRREGREHDGVHQWVRVTRADRWARSFPYDRTAYAHVLVNGAPVESDAALDAYIRGADNKERYVIVQPLSLSDALGPNFPPPVVSLGLDDFANRAKRERREDKVWMDSAQFRGMMRLADDLLLICAYFWMMPEFLVEKTPPAPPLDPRVQRDAQPWTKPRPHVVVIDPVHHIQRQRDEEAREPGTHASPMGHPRRGHVAVLKHPRFYNHPYNQRLVDHHPRTALPDVIPVYQTPDFTSGIDASGRVHAYQRRAYGWYEIKVRVVDHAPAWVGPLEGRERDGTVYRVLDRLAHPDHEHAIP